MKHNIDELKLLSGNDIPFPEGRITIHQPTLKEIGLIDETVFWTACELLKFDKEKIVVKKDNFDLLNKTNFYIIMTMIKGKDKQSIEAFLNIQLLLTLLFPGKELQFDYNKTRIIIKDIQTKENGEINNSNFQKFQNILVQMFCLNSNNKQYDPDGHLAEKIANKFIQGDKKRAQLAPQLEKIAIFSKYTSILAVGLKMDINIFMNYTVYQLLDVFNRFSLHTNYKDWVKYKIAGATGLDKQPPDWLKDIHTQK